VVDVVIILVTVIPTGLFKTLRNEVRQIVIAE